MTKKIITIAILVLISAALIYGSIYRTQAVYGISSPKGTSETSSVGTDSETLSAKELVTLQAIAEAIDSDLWILRLDDGGTVELEGRALVYMSNEDFEVEEGQSLSLVGFYETPDSFEISQVTNLDSGKTITLRGADGRPVWGKGGGGGE